MVDNLLARAIMSRHVQTVQTRSSLSEAVAIMDAGEYGQVPVMEGEKPVGMLTAADVRRAYMQNREDRPVADLASPLPALLKPKTPLSEIQAALQSQRSLLVISASGRLMGIITYWDVLQLARPFLLVTESELLLRDVVAATYRARYGRDWWDRVREDLRQQAELEHQHDKDEEPAPDGEHMLGHMSFWSLIEAFKDVRPDIPGSRYESLHAVRRMRNRVAHHYRMSAAEIQELIRACLTMRKWLEQELRKALCGR